MYLEILQKKGLCRGLIYSENNTNFKNYVDIYYRPDKGKKGKLHMYKSQFDSLYSQLKEGDRLIKEAGK